jgi:hypothetical protein
LVYSTTTVHRNMALARGAARSAAQRVSRHVPLATLCGMTLVLVAAVYRRVFLYPRCVCRMPPYAFAEALPFRSWSILLSFGLYHLFSVFDIARTDVFFYVWCRRVRGRRCVLAVDDCAWLLITANYWRGWDAVHVAVLRMRGFS